MEKIAVWADYDWCWIDSLEEYLSFKSDDYIVVPIGFDIEDIDFEFLQNVIEGCL